MRDWGLGAADVPAAVRRKEADPLWAARSALATTALPAALPCRDTERAVITRFIEDAVQSGTHLSTSHDAWTHLVPANLRAGG